MDFLGDGRPLQACAERCRLMGIGNVSMAGLFNS